MHLQLPQVLQATYIHTVKTHLQLLELTPALFGNAAQQPRTILDFSTRSETRTLSKKNFNTECISYI